MNTVNKHSYDFKYSLAASIDIILIFDREFPFIFAISVSILALTNRKNL